MEDPFNDAAALYFEATEPERSIDVYTERHIHHYDRVDMVISGPVCLVIGLLAVEGEEFFPADMFPIRYVQRIENDMGETPIGTRAEE